jgi:hypothetical protein
MPAVRLRASPSKIEQFDVVGNRLDNGFVVHVALAEDGYAQVQVGDRIAVVHMRPPFTVGGLEPIELHANLGLSRHEKLKVAIFVDELRKEYQASGVHGLRQYVVWPHAGFLRSVRRYSCAGFVYEACLDAGIRLIEMEAMPPVSLDVLVAAYPQLERALADPARRGNYGLAGAGPWPVLLPGYLFHSMARDAESVRLEPYRPQSGDECFPPEPAPVRLTHR